MIAIHAIVTGKVQGVWFRANTQKTAKKFGLTGWVRNLEDGGVELMACGPQIKIDQLIEWLWQGPPLAKVNNVVITSCAAEIFLDFETR